MAKYLDETGLNALWARIKKQIEESGGSVDLSEYLKISNLATINGQKLSEGGNITIGSDGSVYTLPVATTDTLGGIKVSSGLSIDEDGNLTIDDTVVPTLDEEGNIVGNALADLLPAVVIFNGFVENVTTEITGAVSVSGVFFDTTNKRFVGSLLVNGSQKFYNTWADAYKYCDVNTNTPYTNKIYVDSSTNTPYRWDGSTLVALASSDEAIAIETIEALS